MDKPRYCPNFNLIVWKHLTAESAVMTRLRCKSWQCEYCAKVNRDMWRSFLKKRIGRMGGEWWFLTMTAHENIRTPAGSLDNIRSNLDRLFKRVRRVWGRIEYVRVFEQHKTGAYHVHVIIQNLSARVQKKYAKNRQGYFEPTTEAKGKGNWSVRTWFRRTCRIIGMGYMVDIQTLDTTTKAVNYICKYLTKDLPNVRYLRNVQTTEGIGSPSQKGEGGWKVTPYVFRGMLEGATLTDLNLKLKIPEGYWRDQIVYPRPDSKGD